jgi:tetratricopeptide (TPR) repeat protein
MTDFLITLLVIIFLLYFVDRRFIGLFPDILKPWQQWRKLRKLQTELAASPHNMSTKLEAARVLIERKQYEEAKNELEKIVEVVNESAEVLYDLGFCYLKLRELETGESLMLRSLEINPRVRYGEAYLRLAEAFSNKSTNRSLAYLQKFKQIHTSSCEASFRLGLLFEKMEQKEEAKAAYKETLEIYRALPKYKRKSERKWFLLAGLKR